MATTIIPPLAGFEFFALLRLIERQHAGLPRLGRASQPSQEPIRLGQDLHPGFLAGEVCQQPEQRAGKPFISIRAHGLSGPRGPLPTALSEYAWMRHRLAGDSSWRDFLDLFNHRLLCLFYRAWAESQPVIDADRQDTQRFPGYLASLGGQQWPAASALPPASLHGRHRSASGLTRLLADHLQLPVRIEPFAGAWLSLDQQEQTRLGMLRTPLGKGLPLGQRIWSCQHRFRIIVKVQQLEQALALMPGSPALASLRRMVQNYCGGLLHWEMRLELPPAQAQPLRLPGSRLGRNSWLGQPPQPCLCIDSQYCSPGKDRDE